MIWEKEILTFNSPCWMKVAETSFVCVQDLLPLIHYRNIRVKYCKINSFHL